MRNELKFLITTQEKLDLQKNWSSFLAPDPVHPSYSLASIYFDTNDFMFYREKKEGLSLRRKVRFRSYDFGFFNTEKGILEIKGRYNDKVYKKKLLLPMDTIKSCVLDNNWSSISQEPNALEYLKFTWDGGLFPKIMISYLREAFIDPFDGDCRVTFDSYVSGFEPRPQNLERYFHGPRNLLIPEGMHILEVKTSEMIPVWFSRALQSMNLKRKSISKYALGIDFLYFSRRVFNEESLL